MSHGGARDDSTYERGSERQFKYSNRGDAAVQGPETVDQHGAVRAVRRRSPRLRPGGGPKGWAAEREMLSQSGDSGMLIRNVWEAANMCVGTRAAQSARD